MLSLMQEESTQSETFYGENKEKEHNHLISSEKYWENPNEVKSLQFGAKTLRGEG